MNDRFGSPVRKGDILSDPVARSLKNEQMADGLPTMTNCDGCGNGVTEDHGFCPECGDEL